MSTLLTVVLLNIFSTSYGLVCYRCDKQSDLNQCQSAIECRPDEICHGFISEDHNPIRYTLGCIPRTICEKYIFGKRGQFSSGCCRTDYCNLDMVKPHVQSTTQIPITTTQSTTSQGNISRPPCVDQYTICSNASFRVSLCDRNAQPDIKDLAIRSCPVACNYCVEWYGNVFRPPCVDHDTKCSNASYRVRLCDRNAQPDIKDLAIRTCPVACNYCVEWYDAVNRTFCHTCGENTTNYIPCSLGDIYDSSTLQMCSTEQKFCMTDYFADAQGNVDIFKGCVDEATCQQKWIRESSNLDYCLNFRKTNMTGPYWCHFCCQENGCNTNIKPDNSTLVRPSGEKTTE